MNKARDYWNSMYTRPLDKIPWEIPAPPVDLMNLLDKKIIMPSTVLDVGCGTGNYSIFLAEKGFLVTGVDFSDKAINIAKKNAARKKLEIKFMVRDVLKLTDLLDIKFNFIFDYSLLHHIPLEETEKYTSQFYKLLKPRGKLLMVCYSEKDEFAAGKSIVKGKYGNTMYYRSPAKIRKAYGNLKEIYCKKTKLGKRLQCEGYSFLFEKV